MSIKVRFFASIRDLTGRAGDEIEARPGLVARDVWRLSTDGLEPPPTLLVSVNLEFADLDAPVGEGDEVAFMPPVTGG
ncbi:MAG: MoaD/ThiS family protein [Gammaproteobacteria bacterium]|nr:MAG: MoaD/ThiS family protein [Gammaproteobacteria bacterium]